MLNIKSNVEYQKRTIKKVLPKAIATLFI